MAYTAYLNNQLFFSTASGLQSVALITAELDLQAGQAGTFIFTMSPENVAYNRFAKLTSYVDVYRDNVLLFSGRVIEISEAFDLVRTITCEGLLAILADSVFAPDTYNCTLADLVEVMIDSHNAQVGDDKQLTIGTITVSDDYLFRAYEEYDTTISRLMDLVESYGGYMTVTKSNNTLYFDWQNNIAGYNQQGINFGRNLLDITQTESATEVVTVLVPLGAQVPDEETGKNKRMTIASVNAGRTYIENADGIAEYGRIVGVKIWDDVNVAANLKTKAEKWLASQVVNKVTINVTAADLSAVESSFDYFLIGQTIPVKSDVHGIDADFIALEQHLNLLDPAQNQMVLGSTSRGYINSLRNNVRANANAIETVVRDYVTNEKVTQTANDIRNEYTSLISQTAESITATVTEKTAELGTRLSSVEQTASGWTYFIEDNGEKLAYFQVGDFGSGLVGILIGKPNDDIRLFEGNDKIQFLNQNNEALLEINIEGIETPSVSASEQVAFLSGTTPLWAMRKGAVINGGHNLNDIWIGG